MNQHALFFEDSADAIRAAVQALGGIKKVACALRPELPADSASRWLADCLNPDRKERVTPEQVVMILRMAREAEYHKAFEWFAAECGYTASPITLADQRDRLAAAVEDATAALKAALRMAEQAPNLKVAK